AEGDLDAAREAGRIDRCSQIVIDEVTDVPWLTGPHAEVLLEGRQRTDASGELDQHAPHRGWKMQICDAWPPKQQQAAENDEQNESQMKKKDEVGESAVGHAVIP